MSTLTNEAVKAAVEAAKTQEQKAAETEAAKKAAEASNKPPAAANANEADLQTSLRDGLQAAVKTGIQEILASDEFKKTVQQELANALLKELGQQTAQPQVRTFAVPRDNSKMDFGKAKTDIASGATPTLPSAKDVDVEFADLISMGN